MPFSDGYLKRRTTDSGTRLFNQFTRDSDALWWDASLTAISSGCASRGLYRPFPPFSILVLVTLLQEQYNIFSGF